MKRKIHVKIHVQSVQWMQSAQGVDPTVQKVHSTFSPHKLTSATGVCQPSVTKIADPGWYCGNNENSTGQCAASASSALYQTEIEQESTSLSSFLGSQKTSDRMTTFHNMAKTDEFSSLKSEFHLNLLLPVFGWGDGTELFNALGVKIMAYWAKCLGDAIRVRKGITGDRKSRL